MRYAHILSRLVNTPLAISQDKLNILTSNIAIPIIQGNTIGALNEEDKVVKVYKSASINVFDSLVSKNGGGDSGSTSYYSMQNTIIELIKSSVTTLDFYIDSPGGEVSGLFGLASFIASLPSKYGIKTRSFTDGSATSAAYAIMAATQERYATEGANLASIGVIMTLVNLMEQDKQEGVKYTFLRSKEEKALYNPHEIVSAETLNELTTILKAKDTIFNNFVVNNTNVSLETIIDLKGKVILADEALKLNLITGIVSSYDEFLSTKPTSSKKFYQPLGTTMTAEEALVKLAEKETELQATKAQVSLEIAKARQEEQTRCVAILEAANTFMLPSSAALKSIKAGTTLEQTTMMFEIIKESSQLGNSIEGNVGLTPTAGTNITGKLSTQQLMDAAADTLGTTAKRGLR
jgi:ClpP class serine protease